MTDTTIKSTITLPPMAVPSRPVSGAGVFSHGRIEVTGHPGGSSVTLAIYATQPGGTPVLCIETSTEAALALTELLREALDDVRNGQHTEEREAVRERLRRLIAADAARTPDVG